MRVRKGFTQEDLTEKVGLHSTYIGGVERGERKYYGEHKIDYQITQKCHCEPTNKSWQGNDSKIVAGFAFAPFLIPLDLWNGTGLILKLFF